MEIHRLIAQRSSYSVSDRCKQCERVASDNPITWRANRCVAPRPMRVVSLQCTGGEVSWTCFGGSLRVYCLRRANVNERVTSAALGQRCTSVPCAVSVRPEKVPLSCPPETRVHVVVPTATVWVTSRTVPSDRTLPVTVPACPQLVALPPLVCHVPTNCGPFCEAMIHVSVHVFDTPSNDMVRVPFHAPAKLGIAVAETGMVFVPDV